MERIEWCGERGEGYIGWGRKMRINLERGAIRGRSGGGWEGFAGGGERGL